MTQYLGKQLIYDYFAGPYGQPMEVWVDVEKIDNRLRKTDRPRHRHFEIDLTEVPTATCEIEWIYEQFS